MAATVIGWVSKKSLQMKENRKKKLIFTVKTKVKNEKPVLFCVLVPVLRFV